MKLYPVKPNDDDDEPAQHPDSATSSLHARPAKRLAHAIADFAAIALCSVKFVATSFILVLGAPIFLVLLLAGWDLPLLFTALNDLATHYLAAAPMRRLAFSQDTLALFVVATALVSLIRLPRFASEMATLFDHPGQK